MVEQEQLDNIMIQMDGTEKKCESQQVVKQTPASTTTIWKINAVLWGHIMTCILTI